VAGDSLFSFLYVSLCCNIVAGNSLFTIFVLYEGCLLPIAGEEFLSVCRSYEKKFRNFLNYFKITV